MSLIFSLQTDKKLSSNADRQTNSNSTFISSKKTGYEKGSPTNGQKVTAAGGRVIDFPLRVLVQSEMVGAIIGRSGQTIKEITQQSRYILVTMGTSGLKELY